MMQFKVTCKLVQNIERLKTRRDCMTKKTALAADPTWNVTVPLYNKGV